MNWLSNIRTPGLKGLLGKRDTPENLWIKCPKSGELIYKSDLEAGWWVTPAGAHLRISPRNRFRLLFDEERWEALALPTTVRDPLKFRDDKPYPTRIRLAKSKIDAREKEEKALGGDAIKQEDCMAAAFGKIGKSPAVVLAQDFGFMGGSLGMAAGEAFIAAAEMAVTKKAAFIVITASGGARMQEGTLSLMQMPRTTLAIQDIHAAGLPYIVILTDPTSGGVSASYAMLGDIHIAEPDAMIAFSGPRVIEQTIREKLPEGFQRSEFLRERGVIDMVVDRREMKATLARLLGHLLPTRSRKQVRQNDVIAPPDVPDAAPPSTRSALD